MNHEDLTQLIERHRDGDPDAFEPLLAAVYGHMRRIAHSQLAGNERDAVVDTTMIVHEAYFRLRDEEKAVWENRNHFLAVAATAMRQIIIDFVRRQQADKRGGGLAHVDLDSTQIGVSGREATALLDLHVALAELAVSDARTASVFECRYFGGMTDEETAEALDMSLRTAQREWKKARAFLAHRLG